MQNWPPNQLFSAPKSYWYSGILQIVSLYDVYVNAEETIFVVQSNRIYVHTLR